MRKMLIGGLELTIPDSKGQCANNCAMRDLKFEGVCVLFIDIYNKFEHEKTGSMQSELLTCLPTL